MWESEEQGEEGEESNDGDVSADAAEEEDAPENVANDESEAKNVEGEEDDGTEVERVAASAIEGELASPDMRVSEELEDSDTSEGGDEDDAAGAVDEEKVDAIREEVDDEDDDAEDVMVRTKGRLTCSASVLSASTPTHTPNTENEKQQCMWQSHFVLS